VQQVSLWFNYPGKLLTQTSAAQVHSKITPVNFSSSAGRTVKKYFYAAIAILEFLYIFKKQFKHLIK